MESKNAELLTRISKYSKCFQEKENLVMNKWVLIEDGNAELTTYLYKAENQVLEIYVNDELAHSGIWQVSTSTSYLTIEVDENLIIYEQGFVDDTFMLLALDNGTHQFFCNENKLKDKNHLPTRSDCSKYLEKRLLDEFKIAAPEKTKKHLLVLAFISLVICILSLVKGLSLKQTSSYYNEYLFMSDWFIYASAAFFLTAIYLRSVYFDRKGKEGPAG